MSFRDFAKRRQNEAAVRAKDPRAADATTDLVDGGTYAADGFGRETSPPAGDLPVRNVAPSPVPQIIYSDSSDDEALGVNPPVRAPASPSAPEPAPPSPAATPAPAAMPAAKPAPPPAPAPAPPPVAAPAPAPPPARAPAPAAPEPAPEPPAPASPAPRDSEPEVTTTDRGVAYRVLPTRKGKGGGFASFLKERKATPQKEPPLPPAPEPAPAPAAPAPVVRAAPPAPAPPAPAPAPPAPAPPPAATTTPLPAPPRPASPSPSGSALEILDLREALRAAVARADAAEARRDDAGGGAEALAAAVARAEAAESRTEKLEARLAQARAAADAEAAARAKLEGEAAALKREAAALAEERDTLKAAATRERSEFEAFMDGERDKNVELETRLKDARVAAARSQVAALDDLHVTLLRHMTDASAQLDLLSVDTDKSRRAAG